LVEADVHARVERRERENDFAALHHAGLATLTHTPSPMGFLNQILSVDADARPSILLVVGYPAPGCRVPAIGRKPLEAIAQWL
jgi:hypothetical protein